MKKAVKKQQEFAENVREINKAMVIEIFVLIYFILSIFLRITLFITIPATVLIFFYEEIKIMKTKKRMGFGRQGDAYRILGLLIFVSGLVLLVSSPFFKHMMTQLTIPLTLIVAGIFVFLISKFYDHPYSEIKE